MDIKGRERLPLIGVIGSTRPSFPYSSKSGIELGYLLRSYLNEREGTLFTGGVEGVGVDVYAGVIKWELLNPGKIIASRNNRFVTIIPERIDFRKEAIPYTLPRVYSLLANMLGNAAVREIRYGSEMYERRLAIASLGDVLIMCSGGAGTLHEALEALSLGKPVIAIPSTGGTSREISYIKLVGEADEKLMDELGMERGKQIDFSNLHLVGSTKEAIKKLEEII